MKVGRRLGAGEGSVWQRSGMQAQWLHVLLRAAACADLAAAAGSRRCNRRVQRLQQSSTFSCTPKPHPHTPAERRKLNHFESIDYLPPNSTVYRKWLARQVRFCNELTRASCLASFSPASCLAS